MIGEYIIMENEFIVILTKDEMELLKYLAKTQGTDTREALRKSIATETYFQKELKLGSTILIQKVDKEVREVYFR